MVFKRCDLDMLDASRTALGQSFITPLKELFNLVLQGVTPDSSPICHKSGVKKF